MTSSQTPPTLSQDALNALYRELGESRHAIFERNVAIGTLRAQLDAVTAERDALLAKYEPAEKAKPAYTTAEPVPIESKGKARGG